MRSTRYRLQIGRALVQDDTVTNIQGGLLSAVLQPNRVRDVQEVSDLTRHETSRSEVNRKICIIYSGNPEDRNKTTKPL